MGQMFAKAKKEGEMVRLLQPNMHHGMWDASKMCIERA